MSSFVLLSRDVVDYGFLFEAHLTFSSLDIKRIYPHVAQIAASTKKSGLLTPLKTNFLAPL